MLTVYNCITNEHDLRLVGLAVTICALASWTAISLLHHVLRSGGRIQVAWLGVAAASTGFGIWATHFIAMLAFSPGLPSAYNVSLTVLSLIVAIVVTGVGLVIATRRNSAAAAAAAGGVVVGGGIAAMHYIGMAAFEIEGRLTWNLGLVAVSIVLGLAIGAAALPVGLHRDALKWKALGALLLTLAICSLHFTAMAAVSILPDPTIEFSPSAVPSGWLAVAVALASVMIILVSLAGLVIDVRDRRRAALEIERMRGLANAAVEGLVICNGGAIVTVNDSFAALVGLPAASMSGAAFATFVPEEGARLKLSDRPNRSVEGDLRGADGSKIPVELIRRPVDFGGMPYDAVAVRDLRARKEAEQHIRFLAHHDALTGLANRSSFHKKLDHEIESALATKRPLAVMCLDLDRFKEVNDLFGHAEGDRVLQTVASRISGVLDDSQMVARLSGDEFAIIIPRLPNPGVAGRIAENILEVLQNGSESKDETLVSISIGIAICPDDAVDRQSLLSHADTALYRAKKEGRATYRFFEAAMGAEVRDRRLLELELRNAIARDELRLVYQPQKEIRSGKTIGFEALLRWKHPTRGEIPPSLFVPIAEECSAILQIGEWVLRKACTEAASWSEDLTVAVNVSTVQIHNTNFAHALHEILFETGLKPERLELEITETALVRDLDRAVATLRRIKLLGVRIAMDDFGTGYSSLSNLRAFPFDKIKIDGSFIKSVNVSEQAATIVRAVLGLGQGLGLPVLAEGVETAAQLKFLESESCQEAQGFWLGRPAEIEHFRQLTHGEEPSEHLPVVIPLHSKSSSK